MPEQLVRSDPEVAAVLFGSDLDTAFQSERARRLGWKRISVDPLTAVVELSTVRQASADTYFLKLEADWYNTRPPRITFVAPNPSVGWPEAADGSRWLPRLTNENPGIAIHAAYPFGDGTHRQLVCSSVNADYYTTHEPEAGKIWQPGVTTLLWSLAVVQDELDSARYQGPFGADYS